MLAVNNFHCVSGFFHQTLIPFARIWTPDFAYCVGILAADGNLSKDSRHIRIVSKDFEIINNCRSCLKSDCKIIMQSRKSGEEKKYHVLQFSDVKLFSLLQSIGLTPAKSKTIQRVHIPPYYFRDFLRGLFDGDGTISIYKNKVSTQPQVKLRFASASYPFLTWLRANIRTYIQSEGGYITQSNRCYSLDFGKLDAGKIINFMYYDGVRFYLGRKKDICGRVVELAYTCALGAHAQKA